MTFIPYGDEAIKVSLYQEADNSGDGVSFVAIHPVVDIWGRGDIQAFEGTSVFSFKKGLSRSEWAERMKYADHAQAMRDFSDAIKRFNENNLEHPVTKYFLNLMLDAITAQK